MYRKYITGFFLAGMTILSSWLCVRELKIDRISVKPAFRMEYLDTSMEEDKQSFVEYQLSDKDYDALLRIVEAEAGGEDQDGKLLVANVVLNRVNNDLFPDTVLEVVMQKEQGIAQFSPTVDGRYTNVCVSDDTVAAVERALYGEDISRGALYFCAREKADSDKLKWFDRKLTRLFSYGHHEFFL